MQPAATLRRWRRAPAIWAAALTVALLLAVLSARGLAPVAALDRALHDQWVAGFAPGATARSTVFVDIDDVSLSSLGQWPWPRYRLADLIRRTAAGQPAAIALDILLPEPDRVSLTTLRETFATDFGVELGFQGVPEGLADNDAYLAHTIERHGVVGARYFYFDHVNLQPADLATPLRVTGDVGRLQPDVAAGVLEAVPTLARRTAVSGFINSRLDDDGVLRRLPLVIGYRGALHPSLGLAAAMRALRVSEAEVVATRDGPVLRLAGHDVPVDGSGYMPMRFDGGQSSYPRVSALDLLAGRVPAESLRDKVVFIGTSATALRDQQVTAVDGRFPGTQVHAALVENILRDKHLRRPSWAAGAVAAASVVAGLTLAAVLVASRGIALLAAASTALALATLAAAALLHARGLAVPAGAPLLVVAVLFVTFLVLRVAAAQRRNRRYRGQLAKSRQITIESMAAVAETRDPETGAHIKRTQHYVRAIAEELRRSGHYPETLTDEYIDLLYLSAPLHDIGKVGVPDNILLKPGRLEAAEMVEMKKHADYGRRIVAASASSIDGDNFLTIAGEIAGTHHERWDGTGYPAGLAGQAIPLSGRIMAVADIYDALISRRCYKEPFPHDVAMALLREQRGSTFDPAVFDAFLRIEGQIQDIARRYRDDDEHAAAVPPSVRVTAPRAALARASVHAIDPSGATDWVGLDPARHRQLVAPAPEPLPAAAGTSPSQRGD